MWSSIINIDIPKSFRKAIEFRKKPKSVFFGGGTYLVPEKNKKINNIVDINGIVDKSIIVADYSIEIGAGSSLQDMIDSLNDFKSLSESVRYSCFSKNIRNQRTIGGEIVQKRVQSELFTYLIALNPLLEIRTPEKKIVHIRAWDGKGVINKILISRIDLESSGIERFATLRSAPAFVIVAVIRRAFELDFVVSGKVKKVYGQTIRLADFSKNVLKSIISQSVLFFENDQYGSLDYKRSLIETGIQRAVEKI